MGGFIRHARRWRQVDRRRRASPTGFSGCCHMAGPGAEFLHGGGTDVAGRAQEHAAQGSGIGRIYEQAQTGEQVFDIWFVM